MNDDLTAVRDAILSGGDAAHGVTVEMMASLAGESDAHVSLDEAFMPRLLCLSWPLSQRLFRGLGLTPNGLDMDYGDWDPCGT